MSVSLCLVLSSMTDMWGAGQIHYMFCVGKTLNWESVGCEGGEMKWMIKGAASGMKWTIVTDNVLFLAGVNSVMFYLLWTCAPIVVSIGSFFVFVMHGGELIISVPFMVGSLFT